MNATCGIETPGADAFPPPFQGLKLVADLAPGLRKKRSAPGYYVSAFQAEECKISRVRLENGPTTLAPFVPPEM